MYISLRGLHQLAMSVQENTTVVWSEKEKGRKWLRMLRFPSVFLSVMLMKDDPTVMLADPQQLQNRSSTSPLYLQSNKSSIFLYGASADVSFFPSLSSVLFFYLFPLYSLSLRSLWKSHALMRHVDRLLTAMSVIVIQGSA